MKNKVTVTRAERINFVPFFDVKYGHYYLNKASSHCGNGWWTICLRSDMGPSFKLEPSFALEIQAREESKQGGGTVISLGNLTEMCKWVANGRKLEDLQSDTKSECRSAEMLEYGKIFSCKYSDTPAYYVKIDESHFLDLETGEIEELRLANVWPLRAGDTITIEITE